MPATHLWWLRVTFRHRWIAEDRSISACKSAAATGQGRPQGQIAGPARAARPGGSTRWRLGERLWYSGHYLTTQNILATVEVLHSNSDISIRGEDGIERRLTLKQAQKLLHR